MFRSGSKAIGVERVILHVAIVPVLVLLPLAHRIARNPDLKPYHRAAAFTTFTAFSAAITLLSFNGNTAGNTTEFCIY